MKILLFVILILSSCFSYADDQFDKLLNAAEQGNSKAQHLIALRYFAGVGVVKNDELAIRWYRRAVIQGNEDSLHNLGLLYCNAGNGVELNIEACYALLSLAVAINPSGLAKDKIENVSKRMTETQINAAKVLVEEMSKPNNLLVALDAHVEESKKTTK